MQDEQEPGGSKRSRGAGEDGGAEGSSTHKRARPASLPHTLGDVKGHGIVIATCDSGKERQATKELLTLLEESAARVGQTGAQADSGGAASSAARPPSPAATAGDDTGGGASSIEAEIRREVEELKAAAQKDAGGGSGNGSGGRLFWGINTDLRGVVLACVLREDIDPVSVVNDVYARVVETRARQTRFLVRVVPLTATCYGDLDSLRRMSTGLVSAAFGSLKGGGKKWSVQLTRRSTGVQRDEVITMFGQLVPPPHTVSITAPDVIIVVEALRGVVGVSIMEADMAACRAGFNIRKHQDELCK